MDYYCFKPTEVAACVCVQSFSNWLCEWQSSCCVMNLSHTFCFTSLFSVVITDSADPWYRSASGVRIQDSCFPIAMGHDVVLEWEWKGMKIHSCGIFPNTWVICIPSTFVPFKHIRNAHLRFYAFCKFSAVSVQQYEVILSLDCAVFLWQYLRLCSKLCYSDHYTGYCAFKSVMCNMQFSIIKAVIWVTN